MSSFNSPAAYDTIMEIASTRGLNAKKVTLAKHPELLKLLSLVYSPYIHFNVKITTARAAKWSIGPKQFDDTVTELLKGLTTGKISGKNATMMIDNVAQDLDHKSQWLFTAILNKDLRIGLQAKSINSVFPGCVPMFDVQLAYLYESGRMCYPALISPKIDGLRCIYQDGVLRSRNGHKLVGLDHIITQLMQFDVYRVDGELTCPGKHFDEISGAIRSFKTTDNAVFNIFEAQTAKEDPQPQYKRVDAARFICTRSASACIQLVEHYTVLTEEDAIGCYNCFRDEGYEGAVVKDENALPQPGRTWAWQKMKARDTADCEVIGFVNGEGKYEGMVGALIVDYVGTTVSVGSGLSDRQRSEWYDGSIIGKTVEVAYMEITPQGSLRHPRLVCVRGDK